MPGPVVPAAPPVVAGGAVVVPTASSSCPSFGPTADTGTDWNPVDHLPVVGDAKKVSEMVGTIAHTLLSWITDPGRAVHDIFGWVLWHTIGWNPDAPSCYAPTSLYGFARSVMGGDVQLDGATLYAAAYRSLSLVAIVVVLTAGVARMLRSIHQPDAQWGLVVVDITLRMVTGIAGIQLGYEVMAWLLPVFSELGRDAFITLLALAVPSTKDVDPLGILLFAGLGHMAALGLIAVVLIPVLLFQLCHVALLMVMRFLVVSFGIAFLPILIALAVYDHRHKVVQWWVGMLSGAMLAPVVAGAMNGLTIGLALRAAAGDQSASSATVGPLAAVILICGGLWLTGKVLHASLFGFMGRHESVGGHLRGAVEAALMVPLAVAAVAGGAAIARSGAGGVGQLAGAVFKGAMYRRGGGGAIGASVLSASMQSATPISRAMGLRFFETPGEAYAAFKASDTGERLVEDLTKDHMPATATAAQRWAEVEGLPGISTALRSLRSDVHAASTRTGRFSVEGKTWTALEAAVARGYTTRRARGTAAPPEDTTGEEAPE
jgi:hypothetical protein